MGVQAVLIRRDRSIVEFQAGVLEMIAAEVALGISVVQVSGVMHVRRDRIADLRSIPASARDASSGRSGSDRSASTR